MGRVFPCKGNPGQIFQKCVELDQELNGSGPRSLKPQERAQKAPESLGVNPLILSFKFYTLRHDIIMLANPPIMFLTIGHKILWLPKIKIPHFII